MPELTAERFIPDPWSGEPGARLYRTGDRVRYRVDGELEFLGRLDHQVKVRGFRIELGEIESALLGRPGVRDAVVLAREDTPGDRRLVAYVVGEAEGPELRRALGERLPEYMVPSALVFLEALPLTPNGKVDRKALPAPERGIEAASTAPRTPVEELVAGIWCAVLGLERVGREEHFFELGGHSLLAVQVVSRVREVLGVELPVRRLFEAPTLGALALRIEAERGSGARAQAAGGAAAAGGEGGAVVRPGASVVSGSARAGGGGLQHSGSAASGRGSGCGGAGVGAGRDRSPARGSAHGVPGGGGRALPARCSNEHAVLARVDLSRSGRPESEALRLAREDAAAPFDLARGPLVRFRLLRLSQQEHVLLLSFHHIAADGWSLGIWVRELSALYAAFAQGEPSPLPELAVQYADYAAWQREWLQGEVLEGQLAYWREHLSGLEAGLELPADRPRPAVPSYRGGSERVLVERATVSRLEELGRRGGSTLFMTLLALFRGAFVALVGARRASRWARRWRVARGWRRRG